MWEFRILGSRPDPVRLGEGRCSGRSESTKEDCENKVAQLKEKIESGEYLVDPTAVADAIVNQIRDLADARAEHVFSQNECSNPTKASVASTNVTPASPSTTDPIHVSPTLLKRVVDILSSPAQALGGKQTHSS